MAETSVEAATITDMRLAQARLKSAYELASAADRAVTVFGAPFSAYRSASAALEQAHKAYFDIVAALPPADVLAEQERGETAPVEWQCWADDMITLSRGTDVIILSTNEAERLLAELPALIKMAEG